MEKVIITVELAGDNYSAYCNELLGCVTTGDTFEELQSNMYEAVAFHIEGMREDDEPLPKAFQYSYELVFQFDKHCLLN